MHFLKGTTAAQLPVVHPKETHHGATRQPCLVDAANGIGNACSSAAKAHPRGAAATGIGIGSVACPLLVSHLNASYTMLMKTCLQSPNEGRWDTEDVLYTMFFQYATHQPPTVKGVLIIFALG